MAAVPKPTRSWQENLAIGDPLIDMQHKQLLDQMDELVAALQKNSEAKQTQRLLRFLTMYVDNHFGHEEQCMHIRKCPVASQNRAAHEYFKARLDGVQSMLNRQRPSALIAERVSKELLDWFINHIRTIDSQLGACTK